MGRTTRSIGLGLVLLGCTEVPPPPPPGLPGPDIDLSAPRLERTEIGGPADVDPVPAPGGAAPRQAITEERADLRIVTSRIARLVIGEPIEQAFETHHRGAIALELEQTSDAGVIERVCSGRAPVGLISRPLQGDERHRALGKIVLGHHVVALAVHGSQPLRSVTSERLRSVLTGSTRTWRSLNGRSQDVTLLLPPAGPWADHAASLLVPGDRLWRGARTLRSPTAILDFVHRNPDSVGMVGARALELHGLTRGLAIDGALPDRRNYLEGRYPYGVTLRLIYASRPGSAVRALLRWVHSEEGRLLLAAHVLR